MNAYLELKKRHQTEFNTFPMVFAFTQEDLEKGMRKLGLDPTEKDKVCSLFGAGDIIRKSDVETYKSMSLRHRRELEDAIKADRTGRGFIFDMFLYELSANEYGFTEDASDTLEALGITWDDLEQNAPLKHGFDMACKKLSNW